MGNKKITKAVITAAGMGTRFLPQTKAMPKEMLPLNNKPIIQHIVEGLVEAGIEQIILVTGFHKRTVENHFDRNYEVESKLVESGKHEKAQQVKDLAHLADFIYVRQKGGYGNATPVMNAKPLLGDEPFLVVFPDDFFITGKKNEYRQMMDAYNKHCCPVIAVNDVNLEEVVHYGILEPKVDPKKNQKTFDVAGLVEKPSPADAPSTYANAGTYIVTPDVWKFLDKGYKDPSGEHNLPVTLGKYAKKNKIVGVQIDGEYHDTGSPKLYLKAVIDMALRDEELGPYLRAYLSQLDYLHEIDPKLSAILRKNQQTTLF